MLIGIRGSSSEGTGRSSSSSNNNKGVVWEGDMESMSDSLQTLQTEDLSEEEDDNHHVVEAGAATAATTSRHTRRLSPISEGSSTPPFGIQRKSSTGSKDSASPTFLPPTLALPSSSPSTNAQAVASITNPRTTITTNMAPLAPGEGQEEQQQASLVGNRAGNSTSTTSPTTTTTTNQDDEKAARRKRDFERAQKRAAKARVQHARRQQLDEVLVLYGVDPSKMKYDDVPHVLPNWEPPRKEPSSKSLQESSTSVTFDTSATSLAMDESDASHTTASTRKSVSFQTSSTSLHLGESSRSLGTTTTKSVKSALSSSKSKSERQLQKLKKQGSVSFLPLVVVYDDDHHHVEDNDDNQDLPDQLDHSDASHWMDDSSSGRRSTTPTSQPWNDSSHFSTASLNDTSSQHSRRSISSSSYDKYTVHEMMTDAQQLLADMTPDEMAELYRRMEALGSVADSQSELMRLPNAQAKGALILTDDRQGRYYRLELEVLAQFMKDKIKAQKRERRRQRRKLKQQSSSSRRHNNMSTSNEDSRSSSNIIVGESNAAPMAAVPLTPQEEKAARLAKRQQRRHNTASVRRQQVHVTREFDQELPPLTDAPPPSDQELSAAFSIDLDDNDDHNALSNSNLEASMHHLSLVDDMEKGHLTPTSSEEFEAPTSNQDTKKVSTSGSSNKKKNPLENSNDTLDLLESGIIEC